MNEKIIRDRILKEINKKRLIRKNKESGEELKNFSWPSLFAGEEYNLGFELELSQNLKIKNQTNLIDCEKINNKSKEFLENKLKEIFDNSQNQQLIKSKEYPIIWFKNINKIENESSFQKCLLAVFDTAQNTSLFIKGEKVNLSQFILLATISTHDTSQLPNPIFSRLDCVNVDTAKPKEFFLDKYFYPILTFSFLIFLVLILLSFLQWKKDNKNPRF
ncbi:hypothetical protein [endosymbiont GvMRE of Glomus versiforme]|uniref:hypothetical protein n=1 Tax=endosymbiont GvMRE of Glomus versiforme TaxID=2039283 RepID=UPI0011C437AC|nr:hypothetical protein [endosymbiont GvMRE of Glomus versiforme]